MAAAGIPVGVLTAPIIPALNDCYLEELLQQARIQGAGNASYVLLRLPLEVAGLFEQWLVQHYPDRAGHVLSLVRQSREGQLNQVQFGQRMRGSGHYAALLAQRFRLACRRFGYATSWPELDTSQFRRPDSSGQLPLF